MLLNAHFCDSFDGNNINKNIRATFQVELTFWVFSLICPMSRMSSIISIPSNFKILIQAYLGVIAGLVPNHPNKANFAKK